MTRRHNSACLPLIAWLAMLPFAATGAAQFAAPPPGAEAAPLPISGRNSAGGGVAAVEAPVPSTTTSVNTLNPTVSVQGAYSGSASSTANLPFSGKLSLADAILRGIRYNLGAVGLAQAVKQAHSQERASRSALLPNIRGDVADTEETINPRAIGIGVNSPGFILPNLIGPFNIMDLRGRLSQTIADFTALNNYRSAREGARAGEFSAKDAQDLVVLAVAGAYLQVLAANARVDSERSQLETANALYQQTTQQLQFGRAAQIDVNRSRVAVLLQQQRLVTLENDLAKQKINLARLTGLPPAADYELSTDVPYAPAPPLTFEEALQQAREQRPDLKAAEAQVTAAERALNAAHDEYLPSASMSADYGEIGSPSDLQRTYTASVSLNVPIWNGGRTAADVEQAEAALAQRRAELEDVRSQIEGEVRSAYLDMQSAASQVEVAQQNIDVVMETLGQTRQRFEAGVSQNVDVVQSQQSLADAHLDYINSVFAHNVAKLSLARALGNAADKLPELLPSQPRP